MKIAIKHRTNNCKDDMGSHSYYWKFNRAYGTVEQYLFVRIIGLGYTVGFLRRDVTARSRGGGRRWCKQIHIGNSNGKYYSSTEEMGYSMEMAWLEWKEITLAILRKIVKIHKGFPPLSSTPFPSLWPNLVIIFRHLLFTKKLNFGKHLIAPTFHVKQVVSRIKLRLAFFVILFFFCCRNICVYNV